MLLLTSSSAAKTALQGSQLAPRGPSAPPAPGSQGSWAASAKGCSQKMHAMGDPTLAGQTEGLVLFLQLLFSPVCPKSACQHFTRRGESPNKGPAQELMASPLLGWVGECQGWVLAAPPVPGNVVWVGGAGSRVRFLIRGAAGTDTNWNQSQGPGSRCAHSALAAMAWTKLICAGGNAMSWPRQDAIGGLGGSIRPAHVSPSFFTFFPICKQPQLPQRAQH